MENGDFELAGYRIGKSQPVFVTDFQTGSTGERNQDEVHPQDDVRLFGRDYVDPATWSFEFSIAQEDGTVPDVGVLAELEKLHKTWRTAIDPRKPEQVTYLRYMIGGRIRRAYGRPRNFAFDPSQNIEDGLVTATAQFALRDTFTHADELSQVEIGLRQQATGYATLPGTWPLQLALQSTRQGLFTVDSSAMVPAEDITFYGPITNPVLTLDGEWTVTFNGEIPYDGWVRIDPAARTVKDHLGNSRAGQLSRKTYIPDLLLRPGNRGLTFAGQDLTATSRAVIRWRPAYYGL